MKKFNGEKALKSAPVRLRNGQKAYIEKYNEGAVFVYSGYVDDENKTTTSWTKEGTEFCFVESQRDIVSMWQEENEDSVVEADTKDNLEADLEAGKAIKENIFEKALREKLPLRYTILEDNISDFYCIAKTSDGDYILERKDTCAVYVTKLSLFVRSLKWYIATPKLPKAFKPNEGEEFWFIHPTELKHMQKAKFVSGSMFYQDMVNVGLVFRTEEDAESALRFLRNNIEVNHGEEQK